MFNPFTLPRSNFFFFFFFFFLSRNLLYMALVISKVKKKKKKKFPFLFLCIVYTLSTYSFVSDTGSCGLRSMGSWDITRSLIR